MDWQYIANTLKGAWRSLTVWFGGMLLLLPDTIALVQDQWPSIAPYIPDALESRVMNVLALVVLLLRLRTTVSLAAKA
jgi:hypothetical protein